MDGNFGTERKSTKIYVTCVFGSFLSIWLCTLPEKFKQWYEYHDQEIVSQQVESTIYMDFNQEPHFPWYTLDKHHTRISPHLLTGNYKYLPPSWNLLECFEYYLVQNELWTTESIEEELGLRKNVISIEKLPEKEQSAPDSKEDKEDQEDSDEDEIQGNNETTQEAEVVEEESVQGFTMRKQSPEDQAAGIGVMTPVMQRIPRKRRVSASQNSERSGNLNKKRKPTPPKIHYSKADASKYIYKLAAGLYTCTSGLKKLLLDTTETNTREKLQDILHEMKEVMEVKEKLVEFARDNEKE